MKLYFYIVLFYFIVFFYWEKLTIPLEHWFRKQFQKLIFMVKEKSRSFFVQIFIHSIREMLTDAFGTMVNNSFKESLYGKRKKIINVLIVFFISYKSGIKTFLKQIVNDCLKSTHQHDSIKNRKEIMDFNVRGIFFFLEDNVRGF